MRERPRLAVSVDGAAVVIVDQRRGGCIEGLAVDVPHVARVSRPGGRRQAARFSFTHGEDRGNVLELRYDPFYGCRGFGGLIHGVSSCVRVDLMTGRIAPLTQRVNGPGSVSLACDSTASIAGHSFALKCASTSAPLSPGVAMRVEMSVSIDRGPPIAVDRHEGYWDFIHTWVKADNQAVELTIDYGVLE